MSTSFPRASIIVPSFNKAEYTMKTVRSLLAQTYKNYEIIVVDDGSSDDTLQLLSIFDRKISLIEANHGGASSARNLGILHSEGEYIAFVDCDDEWYPHMLSKSIEFLENDPDLGFVFSNVDYIDCEGRIIGRHKVKKYSGNIYHKLILENFICNSSVVVRRSCLERVGYFDESIFVPADWDLWLRLARVYKAGYLKETLVKYRTHQSYILVNVDQTHRESMEVLKRHLKANNLNGSQLERRCYQKRLLSNAKQLFRTHRNSEARVQALKAWLIRKTNLLPLIYVGFFISGELGLPLYKHLVDFKARH